MYEIVQSSRQQKAFEHTWEYFCDKYNWYNDPYAKNGVRYNLLLPGNPKQVIGTIEFVPYDPTSPDSTVEKHFPFSNVIDNRIHQSRIWEIDKLCLHQDYQRKGYFEIFMHVFYDHCKRYKPKYYLALIESRFFRMLRILFGLKIEQIGKALIGPTTALIPVIFDVEQLMQAEEDVKRLLEMKNPPNGHNTSVSLKRKHLSVKESCIHTLQKVAKLIEELR